MLTAASYLVASTLGLEEAAALRSWALLTWPKQILQTLNAAGVGQLFSVLHTVMAHKVRMDTDNDVELSHLAAVGSRFLDVSGTSYFGFILAEVSAAYQEICGAAMPITEAEVADLFKKDSQLGLYSHQARTVVYEPGSPPRVRKVRRSMVLIKKAQLSKELCQKIEESLAEAEDVMATGAAATDSTAPSKSDAISGEGQSYTTGAAAGDGDNAPTAEDPPAGQQGLDITPGPSHKAKRAASGEQVVPAMTGLDLLAAVARDLQLEAAAPAPAAALAPAPAPQKEQQPPKTSAEKTERHLQQDNAGEGQSELALLAAVAGPQQRRKGNVLGAMFES